MILVACLTTPDKGIKSTKKDPFNKSSIKQEQLNNIPCQSRNEHDIWFFIHQQTFCKLHLLRWTVKSSILNIFNQIMWIFAIDCTAD